MTFTPEPRERRTPAVLLPYQQRWVRDRSDVKVCEKSRRTGFSWATAAEGVLEAAAADGQDVWYVGYNKEMAQEFIRDAGDWAKHFGKVAAAVDEVLLEDGDDRKILTFVIRFASGYRIYALSSRPSNLRGKQGLVILDEAAFHESLAELLKAALALTMWGGRIAIISTHDGVDNAFNELVQDVRAKKKPFSLHRVTLDDALADGLYERICLRLGKSWSREDQAAWKAKLVEQYGDGAEEELFCVPRNSGGSYIPRALIEARMVEAPVLRFACKDEFVHLADSVRKASVLAWANEHLRPLLEALPKNLRHAFGEDFGRSGHLSVIAPVTIGETLICRVPFLLELRNVPFTEQELLVAFVAERLPNMCGGMLDSRGNGQFVAERTMQKFGVSRITPVMLSQKWYADNMPPFKAAIEDGTFIVPKHADVLQDLRAIEMIRGIPSITDKETTGTDGGKRHADAAVALVLAHAATKINGGPIEFQSSGTRESFSLTTSVGREGFRGY